MPSTSNLTRGLTALFVLGAVTAVSGCGSSDITKARLEKALAPTFANLYVQRAHILQLPGVTVASTAPSAVCDRGGPKVADVGPGADWICMVTFTDADGKKQTGKFELQVRANSTYVAGGPTKLLGPVMITDALTGTDVPNPPFEFDGAFDPNG